MYFVGKSRKFRWFLLKNWAKNSKCASIPINADICNSNLFSHQHLTSLCVIYVVSLQEKFKREFYRRFSFFHKYGIGKRFHQSASGMATGATTLTDYHDKTLSVCNMRGSISQHTSHFIKKPCCVRTENLLRNNNGIVFKNSYVTNDDEDNFTITSNPFNENSHREYNSEAELEDFEFTKII